MLMANGAYSVKVQEEFQPEEPAPKSKNKKKKNKKKKTQQKEIDPWQESTKSLTDLTQKHLPAIKDAYDLPSEDDKEIVGKIFDQSIVKSVNMVITMSNKMTDMTYEKAHEIFESICKHLNILIECRNCTYIYQISQVLKNLHSENPTALVRAIAEKIIFEDPTSITIFNKFEMPEEFLRDYVTSLFPSIWTHYETKEFKDFMFKFSLMTREAILRQLRNVANQHKSLNRFYEDLSILISEANFTDDFLISKKKYPGKQTTPALTISINFITESMAEYLRLGFPLDLYAPYEFAMICGYLTFIYGILQNNRRIMIMGFCEDLAKSGQISFDDSDNQQFNKKRKKMNALQKLT